MGFFKKVFRPVRKIAKKIIPKEIRPALPFLAATYLGPAGAGTFSSGIKAALQRGLIGAGVSAATDEDGNPLRAGILAATPGLLSETAQLGSVNAELAGMGKTANLLSRTSDFVKANEGLKTIAAQTGIDSSAKLAEINQDEIDKYNENLRKQGVLDKTKRRSAIFGIYQNAGYDESYINDMLDRYGYNEGGEVEEEMSEVSLPMGKGRMTEIEKTLYAQEEGGDKGIMSAKRKIKKRKKGGDDDEGDLASGLQAAARGVEQAFGRSFGEMEPVPMLRFAQGGEVEIEEETDDLGIMDLMRDQGVEYGEQVSNAQNDELLEKLFEEFLELGFSPEDAAKKAREAFDNMSQGQGITGTQVASGYKDDIEEMYEQYVFEMEEQGLQPMSFSQFLAQARAGMADGGIMEKDMRGGGFIPEGTKERADDVPARLSKNEFVMTADAVRAAGGGSVNKGAKRMYDMMYNLEGKV